MNYRTTAAACYIGYVTQAVVNIFPPLLFVRFGTEYSIGLSQISLLITVNFGVQLIVDMLSAKLTAKVSARSLIITAHIFCAAGLVCFGLLPSVISPYAGLAVSYTLCAVGGGLTEVLISPVIEACPGSGKSSAMSLLHSFYCWGSVAVTSLSTLFFSTAGIGHWRILAALWALIPLFNIVMFSVCPMPELTPEGGGMSVGELLRSRSFLLCALLMVCAGASELAMSQWASALAESSLGISKTAGDLLGPCGFAVFMGVSRVLHSQIAEKTDLTRYMTLCAAICVTGYCITVFSPIPQLGIIGCAVVGFSVGVMWPGTFSRAAQLIPRGGTSMFALLALAGDLGCMSGPTATGIISDLTGGDIRYGLAAAVIFPVIMIVCLHTAKKR